MRRGVWTISSFGVMALAYTGAVAAQDTIPEIRVIAHRLAPAPSEVIFSTTVIDRAALDRAGTGRLDDALRDIPGFSLFRRQSSQASHPTTQGVTLRGLGPSGAGRTLVLLDGVPQNDPFGGWIDWNRLPPGTFESVTITRGGGAGQWGNAALAGTIRLQSRAHTGTGVEGDFSGNTHGLVNGNAIIRGDIGKVHASLSVSGHMGDGPYLIRENQRGAVDRRTYTKGGIIRGTISMPIGDTTSAILTGSTSSEKYINGITIAKSLSRATEGAFSLVHDAGPDAVAWEAHVYGRKGNLPAVFSAVGAGRATVTPSLNQFSVPSSSVGGNVLVRIPVNAHFIVDAGADIRQVTGETNELFTYVAPAFTRVRRAGGEQVIGGAFAEVSYLPQPNLTLTGAARIDYFKQYNGARTENVIATGASLLNATYPSRNGSKGNFRFGVKYDATAEVTLRAAAYTGFRVPTINELYRPFRVGNDITEANPNLAPERLKGVEASGTWSINDDVRASATVFYSRIENAVGNVTVQTTPGLNPVFNVFVPAGGTLRQRRNIDRIRTVGAEFELIWQMTPSLEFTGRYLYTDPKITKFTNAPGLVGLRLTQVARHQGVAELSWEPRDGTTVKLGTHAYSKQFDDDQNTRRLAGYATFDLYAEHAINPNTVIFVNGENVFDRTIEAGRSADGLVTIGMPQVFTFGIRWRL